MTEIKKFTVKVQQQMWAGKRKKSANLKIIPLKSSIKEQKEKRIKKNEQILRDLWNTTEHMIFHILEEKAREKYRINVSRNNVFKNPSKIWWMHKSTYSRSSILGRINSKSSTLKHIIIKLSKTKTRETWKQREKWLITDKESLVKIIVNFSS